jgi:hypothetical protein
MVQGRLSWPPFTFWILVCSDSQEPHELIGGIPATTSSIFLAVLVNYPAEVECISEIPLIGTVIAFAHQESSKLANMSAHHPSDDRNQDRQRVGYRREITFDSGIFLLTNGVKSGASVSAAIP